MVITPIVTLPAKLRKRSDAAWLKNRCGVMNAEYWFCMSPPQHGGPHDAGSCCDYRWRYDDELDYDPEDGSCQGGEL